MILNDINIENNPIKSENLGILYKNLALLLETDIRKLNQFLREITNDIQEKNIRKKEIIDKAENSLQEYDLLYFEINSLKQALIPQCEKINQKVLNILQECFMAVLLWFHLKPKTNLSQKKLSI